MAIYCWGNTSHGELGLGGIEDELIYSPREMPWSLSSQLVQAACGSTHTLLLTSQGTVYSCGNNDYGQLGHELSRKRPQPVKNLENYIITQVACGCDHSLALNEWGQIFSWGSDNNGQLGHDNGLPSQSSPKIIKLLATRNVIQIACGKYHSLALTNNGDLYAWGGNSYGQIGNGVTSEKVTKPTLVSSLSGLPISFIGCGGFHSFILSKSGAVYGWGKNTFGQLGINDETSKNHPTQLKTLRSLRVRYISCGEDFSVFLTADGGVFTCGAGQFGQLGHGSLSNEILPRKVLELMGSTITQISCGNRHTLALVSSRGRVYGFGLGSSGQLGNKSVISANVPQVILGPWVSPNGTLIQDEVKQDKMGSSVTVTRIFCGGDHCLVSTAEFLKKIPAYDCRHYPKTTQILSLTTEMTEECAKAPKDISVDLDLITNIESIFVSQTCINASFLLSDGDHSCCTSKHHGVDVPAVIKAFDFIRKIENESLKQIIWDSITNTLLNTLKPSPPDVETLRIYLILPMYHEFVNAKNCNSLHTPFSNAIGRLTSNASKVLFKWWGIVPIEYFEILVDNFKSVVVYIISFKFKPERESGKKKITYESNLQAALNMLVFLHLVNVRSRQGKQKIPARHFHIPEVTDEIDIQNDYIRWIIDKSQNSFYLCKYPFLFDAKAKLSILETDQAFQMHTAMQNAAAQGVFAFLNFPIVPPEVTQFLYITVSREHLVVDTLREIAHCTQKDLKKPLKVKFCGEEAEDAGGVRKEFFMLLLREIIDPKYGMFKEFEETRTIWFSDCSFEVDDMYLLIGIICGLAIYNFTIIDLPFPLALYKKLLKEPVNLSDLRDLSPTMANSLQQLLDYTEDDLQDIFGLNFEITRDIFGEVKVFPLKPDGENIPVTQQNKDEFVNLYIDFIFNKSVEKQYEAFHTGFIKVCGGPVLSLFEPEELMAVVVGNEDYDWHVLQSEAEYKNGYASSDQTVQWFWEVFHELPLTEKKKFLLFLTGSDRIPIKGMKGIKIFIQPTSDDKRLPVAHTCFNLLDLPRYQTKERLKYKLLQAIQQTHGFSLV
ncbi:probable E3 ubiquitin-protein ligase HERC4 isoform X2 [Condylostylus longicornis]|uniref:probable E3 ubiquitin-protein ligase HERC4 isoform X2 n=1 Tax=Condylostylus longicornis TaxID=2530218 RepID=UPI00244E1B5D|nr:probable E3 ubiquitin-protein ligase HERC4 isoform X2 [Condylostylus longicornis]